MGAACESLPFNMEGACSLPGWLALAVHCRTGNCALISSVWAGPDLLDTSIGRMVIQNRGEENGKTPEVHERVQAGGGAGWRNGGTRRWRRWPASWV